MCGNVLALGAVADFGVQNCQNTTKVDARRSVQLTTSPAIEPNACYGQVYFLLHSALAFPTKSKNSPGVCPDCILTSIAENSS